MHLCGPMQPCAQTLQQAQPVRCTSLYGYKAGGAQFCAQQGGADEVDAAVHVEHGLSTARVSSLLLGRR